MVDNYESILSLMRNYLVGDNDLLLSDDIDEMIKLANKLSISPILSYVLNSHGYNDFDEAMLVSFKKYQLQELEKKKLMLILDSNNIEYMFMKGISTCKHYKDPYLRIGSDIDIVVYKKDYKKVISVLKNNRYIKIDNYNYECCFKTRSGILIDLHYRFIETSHIIDDYLFTKFNKSHELFFDDEYLLLIAHSVKHFKRGIIDLRVFSDIFFLKKKIKNINVIENLLDITGLKNYEKTLNEYLYVILGKQKYCEKLSLLETYIKDRTNNIEKKDKIIGKIARDGLVNDEKRVNLGIYIISRIFASKESMYEQFPNCKKNKVLLPFYYLYRPFYMLSKTSFEDIKDELNTINNINDNRFNDMINLYKKIGLYNHIDR